ncbi:MAG: tRNA (adenosine(37)-N6)-threonylcarbamoyltransferase complex ATPase subunit type 1 TsaE [Bacteroidetes bacterium]|nr:tRNA (adenosine(37)-N6)-threonylcarbamoyltransferase complex ATPase subunit type 1 TsaE [Rhodothermia bacterium]MCS7155069.1 tRNA (adenosine(37)-N6)-threonylcarbamoyltransferase complex ATPase subunit type 1 TsaE [Bacteroidota bacterium]MCX7907175.1 tRNA (adenosine(37)-N6)-threonylcarbamoyltransferase complex ATPase subunit type 1 TsaE [Bacteroidota bacterium]MDW8138754.1 tRNA (adenosine(37)-N6)-threonylcarbamoyltransferase complex ATPase subunit type 1 TsaE [Bacteroidota bacterium]MDW828608
MLILHTYSPEESRRLGRELALRLRPGDVVALYGELGAGKTCFVQGVCAQLGVREPVTSPTFTLVHAYQGESLPVYHLDLYRLASLEELYELGYEDYLYGEGVCLIEWADRMEPLLPEAAWRVRLRYGEDPQERIVELTPPPERGWG